MALHYDKFTLLFFSQRLQHQRRIPMSSDILSRPLTGRRSCLVSAGLAFVTYFGVRLLLENAALAGPLRIVIALVPVPFFVYCLLTEIRYIRNLDELQRRIQLEALAI